MHMQNLFKWGKSTLALIPGLFVIFYNLWLPLEIPRILLGGVIEAVGVFTLIVFYQQEQKLRREQWQILKNRGIICFILFLASLIGYIVIYELQNIYSSKYDTSILVPFLKGNELQYMVSKTGNINNAILTYGPEAVRKAINDTKLAVAITKVVFFINYILIFEFLILSFGFIAAKNNKK
jgi:hypothetical protein